MPVRLAACEPCRRSKLACDHARPVCHRCHDRDQAASCRYREKPFKRRRERLSKAVGRQQPTAIVHEGPSTSSKSYPNPGYLGSSSHTTIFEHLSSGTTDATLTAAHSDLISEREANASQVSRGTRLLEQCAHAIEPLLCQQLIEAWNVRGINLPVAGSFLTKCVQSVADILTPLGTSLDCAPRVAQDLFRSSCTPLAINATTSFDELCARFCSRSTRWETLGLFFTAVSRATIDIMCFQPLYSDDAQRRKLQKVAMALSDDCLDIAISLDCLNDLQIFLQYENFIAHSFVEGDQSYQSWRRLGDVISSLFALGYHEQTENEDQLPTFLRDLKRNVFARTYSADKNVSIFLGRPPRVHRRYCRFRLPGVFGEFIRGDGLTTLQPWKPDQSLDYLAETRWSALCALLKEEILDLSHEHEGDSVTRASIIQATAESQWMSLPAHFRLETPLEHCSEMPCERDFLVSARLNHLHILFLLRLMFARHVTNHDAQLLAISAEILRRTVEAMLLKAGLASFGTSLVWRVSYYGLPAAGIICLALLNNFAMPSDGKTSRSNVLQDLIILVAHVESRSLVHVKDPNFALLSRATQTIRALLDRLLNIEIPVGLAHELDCVVAEDPQTLPEGDIWDPWAGFGLQEFETDFWSNLAEHPFLSNASNEV